MQWQVTLTSAHKFQSTQPNWYKCIIVNEFRRERFYNTLQLICFYCLLEHFFILRDIIYFLLSHKTSMKGDLSKPENIGYQLVCALICSQTLHQAKEGYQKLWLLVNLRDWQHLLPVYQSYGYFLFSWWCCQTPELWHLLWSQTVETPTMSAPILSALFT